MPKTEPARAAPAAVAGLLVVALLAGCKPGGPAESAADTGAGARAVSTRPGVVALLVADTAARASVPGFALDVERNVAAVRRTLAGGIGADRLAVVELRGDRVRPEHVEAAVRALPVTPSDTVVCYVAGRATADLQNPDGFRFALHGSGNPEHLPRSRLREWLTAKKPHLVVLLSDTAGGVPGSAGGPLAGRPSAGLPDVPADVPATPPDPPDPTALRAGFQSLFLTATGVVDLTGADDGAGGWGVPGETGFFTRSLCRTLTTVADYDRAGWPAVYADTRAATWAAYQAWRTAEVRRIRALPQPPPKPEQDQLRGMIERPEQTPRALYLTGSRVKIFTRDAPGGGAEITELPLDSPGRRAGLKAGEVVTRVGDAAVATAEAWGGAVGPVAAAAGRQVLKLTVRGTDGQERAVPVELPE